MAYVVTNPPHCAVPGIGSAPSIWTYVSADDDATVNGGSYFSNGVALGMKVGDLVYVFDTDTPEGSVHYVVSVSGAAATTAFAAVA
jgi:hypothetical protein